MNHPLFEVVVCLRVLKYIHLRHADQGLQMAFRKMNDLLLLGGHLVLEDIRWKSYRKKKDDKTYGKYLSAIKIKPETFPELLVQRYGFELVARLKSINVDKYKQDLLVFRKIAEYQSS